MSATAQQQPRNYGWTKNIIEKRQIRGYLNEDRLLNRLMELFPGVRCKDDFALDTVNLSSRYFLPLLPGDVLTTFVF